MAAVIGALRAVLSARTAQFETDMGRAGKAVNGFAGKAKAAAAIAARAFAGIAVAATAMAGALGVGIKRTIDTADAMTKAAQKFGVPIDELTRLRHAADLSGVAFEGLGTGLRKLAQSMQQFAIGASNEASQAFKALGISVKEADGTLKSSSQVLSEIADRFAKMDNGAQKTAIAMAIFGRSGADLIPLLNSGADGLAKMKREADELGIVLDQKTGKAAEAFNDNLNRLGKVKDAIILKITEGMLPTLERLSEMFLSVAKDSNTLSDVVDFFVDKLKATISEVIIAIAVFKGLGAVINGVGAAIRFAAEGDFAAARDALAGINGELRKIADDASAQIDRILTDAPTQGEVAAAFETLAAGGAAAGRGFVANFSDELDKLASEAAVVFEKTRTPAERYAATIARLSELLKNGLIDQTTYNRAVVQAQDVMNKARDAADKFASEAERVFDATRTPAERYAMTLERLNLLLQNGKIDQETFTRAVAQAGVAFNETAVASGNALASVQSFAIAVTDSFEGLFDRLLQNGKIALEDLRQAALSLAKQLFIQPFFNALRAGIGGSGVTPLFGGGGLFGGGFAGFFAAGGRLGAGQFGIAGEAGPEIVRGPAIIEPLDQAAGGGRQTVNQFFNISTPNADSFRASQRQISRLAKQRLAVA